MSTLDLAEIDRILDLGNDADDVLRAVAESLVRAPGIVWAGVFFLDEGVLTLGPEVGVADPSLRLTVPVSYQDVVVGQVAIDGETDPALLEQVAARISTHVLLGWDTGGEAWEP